MSSDLPSAKQLLSPKYTAIVILLIVSIGVYLNTLPNDFVYDDEYQVLGNLWLRDVKNIPEIFFSNVWAFEGSVISNYYRPLMHIIYMIDYHIFGLKPWGFHLTNILFHGGVSILVFIIASMLINQSHDLNSKSHPEQVGTNPKSQILNLKSEILSPAFIAALLFAIHPIHTEAVAWIGGVPELLFSLFYLLSFYLYSKTDRIQDKRFVLSLIFFFLATLCKETALTLPILLFAYDYSISRSSVYSSRFTVHSIIKRYLPYLIVAGVCFVLRSYALGGFAPLKRHAQLSNYEYFINIFPLFIKYLEKLILPINLNVFYVFHPISSIFQLKGIIALSFTLGFIFLVYFFRRHKAVFLCLLWIVIPLLPVFYIPALGENTFSERYLYLPSVGFVVLAALAIERIYQLKVLRQSRRFGIVIVSILVILTGLYSIGTIKRNYIWRDEYTLWTDTIKKSPDSFILHINIGNVYSKQQRFEDAMREFMTAIKLKPDYPGAHNNLGLIYSEQQRFEDAINEFMTAIKLKPDYPDAHNNFGLVYLKQQRFEDAIKEFMIAIKLKPDYPDLHYNLAFTYSKQGRFEEAINEYMIAIKLKPDYADAYNNLGLVYLKQQRFEDAIKEFMIAIKLKPDSPEPHNDLGNIYSKLSRFEDAIKEYMIAIKLKPDYAEAHNNIGNAYAIQGKLDEAIKEYLIVLKLTPEDSETHNNIANAYIEKREIDKAMEHYQIAMKFNPAYYEAHYNLGLVYLEKGLKHRAEEEFKTALKLRPDFTPAKEALESIK